MNVFKQIIQLLDEEKIPYEHLQHEHVHTSQDAAKVRGTKLEQAAKAIVLKEKKTSTFYLFIVAGNRKLDLNTIKKEILNVKNISLAPPEEVLEKTGCKVGTVPPFGNLLGLPSYLDKHLVETQEELVFSAGTHHDSIKMKTKDFILAVKPTVAFYSKTA